MKNKSLLRRLWEQRQLQMMVIPGMIFILVFFYFPMYGLIVSFQNYKIGDPLFSLNADWVNFKHFDTFIHSPEFGNIMRNTMAISVLRLLITFPAPIFLAILINEVKNMRFKKIFQSISYLPYFISWVVVGGLIGSLLSYNGTINGLLTGLKLIDEPIMFMGEKSMFWYILIGSDLWKNVGWNTIVFLAAMAAIDPALYEAANIDGANRWQLIRFVTLPGIVSTTIIVFLMTVGSLLTYGFEPIMQLTNNLNNKQVLEVAEIVDTHVLRMGINLGNYSYATAVGLFRSVISVVLLTGANWICKKKVGTGLW